MAEKQFQTDMEELKKQVAAISEAVKELRQTGIRDSVLHSLIQTSAKRHADHHTRNGLSLKVIRAVLDGIETFEEYVFPVKD